MTFGVVLPIIWTFMLCCLPSVTAASANDPRPRLHLSPVEELTGTLLFHRDDPFADEDKWGSLSDTTRKKWFEANYKLPSTLTPSDLLQASSQITRSHFDVHVDVQVIAPPALLTPQRSGRILRYAPAMRAGHNGTSLNFTVSIAPPHLFERLSMGIRSQTVHTLSSVLTPLAKSSGALNLLYVIVNSQKHPVIDHIAPIPFLATSRAAFFVYTPDDSEELRVTDMLIATERAAQRVFAPPLMYFPIPLVRDLQVAVTAYTPLHEHRALWLQDFSWDAFESSVRAHVLPGQRVRFVSSQTNSDCKHCKTVFQSVARPSELFVPNVIRELNGGILPNSSWAAGLDSPSAQRFVPPNTLRLFVLDTVKLRKSEALGRLERRRVFSFPGISLIVIRSSDTSSMVALRPAMVRAVVSSLFGFADPDLFISDFRVKDEEIAPWPTKASPLLLDVATRNVIRSAVERYCGQLNEMLDGMIYFEVDPTQSLNNYEYQIFIQRLNYLIFKLDKARISLNEGDNLLAMYLLGAAAHDIRAIRAVFDIEEDHRVLRRFRDPTIRCHFSRFKREALRASELLESTYPSVRPALLATLSYCLSTMVAKFVTRNLMSIKSHRKRE